LVKHLWLELERIPRERQRRIGEGREGESSNEFDIDGK
jgi:hypothetical protein